MNSAAPYPMTCEVPEVVRLALVVTMILRAKKKHAPRVTTKRGGRAVMRPAERFRMLSAAWFFRNVVRTKAQQTPRMNVGGRCESRSEWHRDVFAGSLLKRPLSLDVPIPIGSGREHFGPPFDDCAEWLGLSDDEYRAQLPKDVRHDRERRARFYQGPQSANSRERIWGPSR
jgi:hypothetical protein